MARRQARPADDRTLYYGLYFDKWADPRIRDAVSLARPILVFARQSGEARSNAPAVSSDLSEAIEALHVSLGIDCRHLVPGRDVLIRGLKDSKDTTTSVDYDNPANSFKHTYFTVDLRPTGAALVLVLALGSSHHIASDRNNPFIVRIANEVGDKTPILLFAKNTSRQFRQSWAQAPLREELLYQQRKGREVFQGTERGISEDSPFKAANDLLEGEKNRAEAESFVRNAQRRILTRTGQTPVFDPAGTPWHHAASPPPGFVALRLMRTARRDRDRYLLLDSPALLPPQNESFDQIPNGVDTNGDPADQVANVRWFLTHAGLDGLTGIELAHEMTRRGFTTPGLRRQQQNPHITYAGAQGFSRLQAANNPIVANLATYETGTLIRKVGTKAITLTNAFPPDGPWAAPEDFDRIKTWLADLDTDRRPRGSYTFSGLPLTVNGRPAVLRVSTGSRDPSESQYDMREPGSRKTVDLVSPHPGAPDAADDTPIGRKRLRHSALAEAILEAIIASTRHPVLPVAATTDKPAELIELGRHRDKLTGRRGDIEMLMRLRAEQVDEIDDQTGKPLLSQMRRKLIWEELDTLAAELEDVEADLGDARALIGAAEARHDLLALGAETDAIVDMITSLRSPRDCTYRDTWLRAIRDLAVTVERVTVSSVKAIKVTMTFKVRLSDGDTTIDVPAYWEHTSGIAGKLDAVADAIITDLRRGVTLTQLKTTLNTTTNAYSRVWDKLGFTGPAPQLQCPDPDLLRLHLAVIDAIPTVGQRPTDQERAKIITQLATRHLDRRFGSAEALIGRIIDAYHAGESTGPQYRRAVAPSVVEALTIAAGGGVVNEMTMTQRKRVATHRSLEVNGQLDQWHTGRGPVLRLRACPHCGGRTRVASPIREVTGYVCLSCRRDAAAVVWDAAFDPLLRPASVVAEFESSTALSSGSCTGGRPARSQLPNAAGPESPSGAAAPAPPAVLDTSEETDPLPPAVKVAAAHLGEGTARGAVRTPAPMLAKSDLSPSKRQFRQLTDVDDTERGALATAYDRDRQTLSELSERHRISRGAVREIIHAAGLLRSRGRRPHS